MLFISFSFAIFFLFLVIIYHLLDKYSGKIGKMTLLMQNSLLLVASLFFYAFADLRFVPFLFYVILISFSADYFCYNKYCFIILLIADIGPLLSIKYLPLLFCTNWIFPLGISFFTFQSISYIVDIYTKKKSPERNLLYTALFISFFPAISSGPIQRAEKLIPQFKSIRKFDYYNATDGMKLFAWGMFKKLCIADRIAIYVNCVYGSVAEQYGIALLFATILYSFQIYCDFSGYTDMAIGIARYLGFDIGKNFEHPYLSQSIGEFWRRWHISLSSWLRDYVYIPIGGSRVSLPRIYVNLLVTFLVSGIWHGSTWNFVIWGLLHGIYQCIGRYTKNVLKKINVPAPIKIFITFCLVTFTWIFFRSSNLHEAVFIISKIAEVPQNISQFLFVKGQLELKETFRVLFALNSGTFGFSEMIKIIFLLGILIICELFADRVDGILIIRSQKTIVRWILYLLLILLIYLFIPIDYSTNFIYQNF